VQLAIDGKVEQRPVAQTPFSIEPEPDGPDLLRLESALRADHASGVPLPPLPDCRVELRMPILSSPGRIGHGEDPLLAFREGRCQSLPAKAWGKRTGGLGGAMLTLTLTLTEATLVRITHRLRRFANVR
jgi:hypothetical protein